MVLDGGETGVPKDRDNDTSNLRCEEVHEFIMSVRIMGKAV
jgi:hypothetical protein